MKNNMIEYRVERRKKRGISIEITHKGEVVVRAPMRATNSEIRSFVESKTEWINKHLQQRQKKIQALGDACSETPLTKAELEALKEKANAILPGKVVGWAAAVFDTTPEEVQLSLFDKPKSDKPPGLDKIRRITIRRQKTVWGSYNASGDISLNVILMLLPTEIQDYVVVHELCHALHMNHSKEFWGEVARVLPDYKMRRKWLKDFGPLYLSRLPD